MALIEMDFANANGGGTTVNTTHNLVNDGTFTVQCTNALFYVGMNSGNYTWVGSGYVIDGVYTPDYVHPTYPLGVTYSNGTLTIPRSAFDATYNNLRIMYS